MLVLQDCHPWIIHVGMLRGFGRDGQHFHATLGFEAMPTPLGAILPTLRQQGVNEETDTRSPCWSWARLLHRVFALDMARCPFCQRGTLRLIAVIT